MGWQYFVVIFFRSPSIWNSSGEINFRVGKRSKERLQLIASPPWVGRWRCGATQLLGLQEVSWILLPCLANDCVFHSYLMRATKFSCGTLGPKLRDLIGLLTL